MPRWLRTLAVAMATLLFVVEGAPAERGGVRMADRIAVGGKALTLNGMGIREATLLNIDVYVAGLYLERA